MCGVAAMCVVPAATAARAKSSDPSRSAGPSSRPGRMWLCRSITPGPKVASPAVVRPRDVIADLSDAPVTVLLLGGVVVLGALAVSDAGYPVTAWAPGGIMLLALLGLALAVLPHQLQAVSRATRLAAGLLAAYTAWSYASIAWADDRGAAWTGANRTL